MSLDGGEPAQLRYCRGDVVVGSVPDYGRIVHAWSCDGGEKAAEVLE